jgi:tetratricopeptide (TPR) repeat protein
LRRKIVAKTYNISIESAESERLFNRLDGLPLAIAQAGAYLRESGVGLATYLKFYEKQWAELIESQGRAHSPLQDYPDRSVWTTWTISYNAVRNKHETAANLLLLWSFLDNKDLWFDMFSRACERSWIVARMLVQWIGDIANIEQEFVTAMQILRNYSLIEDVEGLESYATHPVVHTWTYNSQGKLLESKLSQLAIIVVGWAVPHISTKEYSKIQQRLLPHAEVCSRWVLRSITKTEHRDESRDVDAVSDGIDENESMLDAILLLGNLYKSQGKLAEAEKMYERALQGKEKALGAEHTSTLDTVNNLGGLYSSQGKLAEAEKMYERALQGKEKALGAEHTSTLGTVNNLGGLYADQGKLAEAEKMYERALQGYEKALGAEDIKTYIPALNTNWAFAALFQDQGELAKARAMYSKALEGYQKVVGYDHPHCQTLRKNLSLLGTKAEDSVFNNTKKSGHTRSKSKRHKLLSKLGFR